MLPVAQCEAEGQEESEEWEGGAQAPAVPLVLRVGEGVEEAQREGERVAAVGEGKGERADSHTPTLPASVPAEGEFSTTFVTP